MRQCLIYGLTDPRTGEVRYVGKTVTGLFRAKRHGNAYALKKDNTHKANWIRSLLSDGVQYGIRVLEHVAGPELLDDAERRWIATARADGWPLTNLTDGGSGTNGYRMTPEHKAKIAAAHTGKKMPEEQRARLSADRRGKPLSLAAQEAARRANIGHTRMNGRRWATESRRKMSRSMTIVHAARRREVPPRLRVNLLAGVNFCTI